MLGRRDGEQKLSISKQRGLADFGGFRVGIEGVSTQPPSRPVSLGHADGEQKSALATLLYWHRARRCLGEETGSRNR